MAGVLVGHDLQHLNSEHPEAGTDLESLSQAKNRAQKRTHLEALSWTTWRSPGDLGYAESAWVCQEARAAESTLASRSDGFACKALIT